MRASEPRGSWAQELSSLARARSTRGRNCSRISLSTAGPPMNHFCIGFGPSNQYDIVRLISGSLEEIDVDEDIARNEGTLKLDLKTDWKPRIFWNVDVKLYALMA